MCVRVCVHVCVFVLSGNSSLCGVFWCHCEHQPEPSQWEGDQMSVFPPAGGRELHPAHGGRVSRQEGAAHLSHQQLRHVAGCVVGKSATLATGWVGVPHVTLVCGQSESDRPDTVWEENLIYRQLFCISGCEKIVILYIEALLECRWELYNWYWLLQGNILLVKWFIFAAHDGLKSA